MSAVVRPYHDSDAEWDALYDLLEDEHEDLNREASEVYGMHAMLRRSDLFLVALDGARVTGFVALRRDAGPRHEHAANLRLHVRKEYRSNGVGAKLLRRALWWSDRNGITRVVATPYVDFDDIDRGHFPRSVTLFEKHGFEFEGVQRKAARLLDGTYTDVALMARVVNPAKEDT